MATIKDVAKHAGVSQSTVSRVLNNTVFVEPETKEKILNSIRELGYRPNMLAKALKEGKTKTIAFIIPNLENMIYPTLAITVEAEARKRGYFVLFCNTFEDAGRENDYINKLRGQAVDGFLFSTGLMGKESEIILQLKRENYPVVCLMRETDDPTDSFVSENEAGGYMAARYLLEKGHRKIATITGRRNLMLYSQRLAGFTRALKEWGIPVEPSMIWDGVDEWKESAQACVTEHLKGGEIPEAIFAQSDPLAFDTIITLNQMGYQVPEDVSVIGFDNIFYSNNFNLTTIEQPLEQMAVDSINRLIDLIDKKAQPHQPLVTYPVRVVERKTVKER